MYEYLCSHSFFIADSNKDFLFAVKNFDIKLFKLNKKFKLHQFHAPKYSLTIKVDILYLVRQNYQAYYWSW